MSQKDRELLQRLTLSQSDLAKLIGVTRQSVSKGLEGSGDYLNADRIYTLYKKLKEEKSPLITALKELIEEHYPSSLDLIEQLEFDVMEDDPHSTYFDEVWIFTHEPKELSDNDYLEKMKESFFSDTKKTIIYFVPPGNSSRRMKILLNRIDKEEKSCKACIYIVESQAFSLSPHFIVSEPRTNASGYVEVVLDEKTKFIKVPPRTVTDILSAIREVGIGFKRNELVYIHDNKKGILDLMGEVKFKVVYCSSGCRED